MAHKFSPTRDFSLQDPEKGRFNKDSQFIDGLIREHVNMSGVVCQILLMKGIFQQDDTTKDPLSLPPGQGSTIASSLLGIQDTILMETRDRMYIEDFIPVKGVYQVSQYELEYSRFGQGLSNDTITMEFHLQNIETQCGRRLIPGDVIELPHLREVDLTGRIANKWYEIKSVVKAPGGFDAMYGFHILGCVLKPARDQQELFDIMRRTDEYGKTHAQQSSTYDAFMDITAANQTIAEHQVNSTWWDTSIMYFDPHDLTKMPFRETDDAQPPNGLPVNAGPEFPPRPAEFDYFVRSDLDPHVLYQFANKRWRRREVDRKRTWSPYNWLPALREFMSDRSPKDAQRNWDLRSVHDVLTDREYISDPSPRSTQIDVDETVTDTELFPNSPEIKPSSRASD